MSPLQSQLGRRVGDGCDRPRGCGLPRGAGHGPTRVEYRATGKSGPIWADRPRRTAFPSKPESVVVTWSIALVQPITSSTAQTARSRGTPGSLNGASAWARDCP